MPDLFPNTTSSRGRKVTPTRTERALPGSPLAKFNTSHDDKGRFSSGGGSGGVSTSIVNVGSPEHAAAVKEYESRYGVVPGVGGAMTEVPGGDLSAHAGVYDALLGHDAMGGSNDKQVVIARDGDGDIVGARSFSDMSRDMGKYVYDVGNPGGVIDKSNPNADGDNGIGGPVDNAMTDAMSASLGRPVRYAE